MEQNSRTCLTQRTNERKYSNQWKSSIDELDIKELIAAEDYDVLKDDHKIPADNYDVLKDDHKIPAELMFMYEGLKYEMPESLPFEKPSWYDEKKFKAGQKFANDFYVSVLYAETMSFPVIYSFEGHLSPLIYTRRTTSLKKAAKRYLSTTLRVQTWYEEDIWDKNSAAYKNMLIVRAHHRNIAKKMMQESKEGLERKTKLKNVLPPTEIKNQSLAALKEDFQGTCPFWAEATKSDVPINQAELSFTMFGFMGLPVLYPEKLGIFGATEEDLDGFVHLWRVLGYLLGIQDRFNFCQGTFDEVKVRCRRIVDNVFIPNLPNLGDHWEHMSRCLVEGVAMLIPGPTFENSLLHVFGMAGVEATTYKKKLKWKYIILQYGNRFLLDFVMKFTWVRIIVNTWVKKQMRLKALAFNVE